MAVPVIAQSAKDTDRSNPDVAASFGTTPTVNNLIVVCVGADKDLTSGSHTVTDNQGNTYTKQVSRYGSGSTQPTGAAIWTAVAATSSGTFTVTANHGGAGGRISVGIMEISGEHATSYVNATQSGLDQSGAESSPMALDAVITTTVADCLIIANGSIDNGSPGVGMSADTDYTFNTDAGYSVSSGTDWNHGVVYRSAATATGYTANIILSDTAYWAETAIAIAPEGGGAVPILMSYYNG